MLSFKEKFSLKDIKRKPTKLTCANVSYFKIRLFLMPQIFTVLQYSNRTILGLFWGAYNVPAC